MPLYTVLAPPVRAEEGAPDPMAYVLVKEGFSWPALIIPELWLLFRRMWLVFFVFLAVSLIVLAIDRQVGGPLPELFLVLAHILFALEGNGLRRWTLIRRGYQIVDVVEGRRVADADVRFFHDRDTPRSDPTQPSPERLQTTLRRQAEQPQGQPAESASPAPPEPSTPTVTVRPFREQPDTSPSTGSNRVVGLFPERGSGS